MPEHDPLQSLWKSQKQEDFSMTLADIHARAECFQSRIRRRNWIEYAGAALAVAGFTWAAFAVADVLIRAACVLIILGTLYVAWKLATVARASARTDETMSWADFHRAELVRQRDALNGVWRWYLGPLIPGMTLFWIGVGLARSADSPLWVNVGVAALGLAIAAGMFCGIAALNKRAAKTLQAEIDALDRARGA
jgi:hypothetical protein